LNYDNKNIATASDLILLAIHSAMLMEN